MKRYIPLIMILLLAGCDSDGPTAPVTVIVSPAINCESTTTAGEIVVTDESRPANIIDQVSGRLFNAAGNNVCSWSISREGNLIGSFTCRALADGAYTFDGNIVLNNGQAPVPVSGRCSLP